MLIVEDRKVITTYTDVLQEIRFSIHEFSILEINDRAQNYRMIID